jgi:peptidoglycan/LPS O-acetylase OafA/YrhL
MASVAVRVPTVLPEKNLDVQRAMAVLSVLACHTWFLWIQSTGAKSAWAHTLGQRAVDAFFVHTSLVLMLSLERISHSSKSVGEWWSRFMVKRFFRFYPLLIVTVLAVALLRFPFDTSLSEQGSPAPTWKMVLASMTLFQNMIYHGKIVFVPLWTLPLEWQMYIVLPLCFLIQERGWRWLVPFLLLGVAAGIFQTHYQFERVVWRFEVVGFAPCFLAGVLAFYLLRIKAWKPWFPAWLWPLALVALTASSVVWATYTGGYFGHYTRWVYCLGVALFIPCFKEFDPKSASRLAVHGFAFAKHVAARSYSIYLLHLLALAVVWRGYELEGAYLLMGAMVAVAVRNRFSRKGGPGWTLLFVPLIAVLLGRKPDSTLTISSALTFIGTLVAFVAAGYELVEVPGMKFGQRVAKWEVNTVGKKSVQVLWQRFASALLPVSTS